MNKFAWSLTFSWKVSNKDFPYNSIITFLDWITNIFLYWETEISSSKELTNFFEKNYWEIISFDISIETEDKIFLNKKMPKNWVYQIYSIEWINIDFENILEWYKTDENVVSIREVEQSKKFWNKIIRIDFLI